MKRIIVFGAILLLAVSAHSRESTEIVGARWLGMGGCTVAVSRGAQILFSNPAFLDRLEGGELIFGDQVSVNRRTFEVFGFFLDHLSDFKDVGEMSEEEQNDFFDLIIEEINFKRMNLSSSVILPAYLRRPAGAMVFGDANISAVAFSGVGGVPVVDLTMIYDLGVAAGYAYGWNRLHEFLPGRLSVGGTLKWYMRHEYSTRQTVTVLSDEGSFGLLRGSSFGLDVGLLYDLRPELTLGLAIYDLLASDIEWKGTTSSFSRIQPGEKLDIQPSMRLGLAYTKPLRWKSLSCEILALDIVEPFDSDITFFKKIRMGSEVSVEHLPLKLRFGVSEGYPALGFSLGGFTYAWYNVELGRHAGQVRDSRHIISFAF